MSRLTLYTSGRGSASLRAILNLRAILADVDPMPELTMVDVDLHPEEAARHRVFVTPFLRVEGAVERVAIGALDDRELIRLLIG